MSSTSRFTALYAAATALVLTSCSRYASNPMELAPSTPYATWTPLAGNQLVSSCLCQPLVPPSFDTGKLTLSELIDIALQNNPTTKESWARARAAAAQYGQSLSKFYPNISFNGSLFRQKATFIDTDGSVSPYFATQIGPDIELTYTLFDFGQRTSASLAARESLYYADAMHNQQIQATIQVIMDDYYGYLYAQVAQMATEADLENAKLTLDIANEKFLLGIAALGEVAQARSQYLQSKIGLTSQKQATENAFSQLAAHLGLPANIPFQVEPMPQSVTAEALLNQVDQLVAFAQKNRQDMIAAEANVRSKEASLLNAKRANLPVFNTTLDVGRYWFQQNQKENFLHWYVQVNLVFPIFDGYSNRNAIRTARANLELSQAQQLQTELSVIQQITTAHVGVKTAAENLTDSTEYVKAAQLEFDIALANYKAGTMTVRDVISAQSNLADARAKSAASKRDWFTSLAAMAYATGSLCSLPMEAPCVD